MNSIIHFTKEYNTLKQILDEKAFRLHYCREVFYLSQTISSSAVHPMVSFSEHRIEGIDKKVITYGKFGIALKKRWVEIKKIHPVLYLDRDSHLATALSDLLKARRKKAEIELTGSLKLSIMTIKCFVKNTRGHNSYLKVKNFNFKAEREWRYVPTKSEIGNNLISQTKRLYEKDTDKYNNKLINFPLEFSIDDIEYVFVENVDQQIEISNFYKIDKDKIKISMWSTKKKLTSI